MRLWVTIAGRRVTMRLWVIGLLLLAIGCSSGAEVASEPTTVPFPTVTPGRVLVGQLSTPSRAGAFPVDAQATPTPDASTCPTLGEATLPRVQPETDGEIINEIVNYLSVGGAPASLEVTLRERWGLLEGGGFLRDDIDLTGEGVPEVIIGYTDQEATGTVVILGCVNGSYVVRYQGVSEGGAAPQIVLVDDLNNNDRSDVLFVYPLCAGGDREDCDFDNRLIAWEPSVGRFVNLLGDVVITTSLPETVDMDSDDVSELVVYLDDDGNATTGPLRTGVQIYDWDGTVYVLSIVNIDPPQYRIQIVHQADRYFLDSAWVQATSLYQRSLDDGELRNWRSDEEDALRAYTLYRLLLTRAGADDNTAEPVYQQINQLYPDPENAVIYALMGRAFWQEFGANGDPAAACEAVLALVEERPEALELINRYGTRSPTYSAEQLCPF